MDLCPRARSDYALRCWASLNERPAPSPSSRVLSAVLALAAVVAAVTMPLPWRHLLVPSLMFSGPDTVVPLNGVDAASWLTVVALIATGLAVRTFRCAPSPGTKVVIALLAFATLNGMFIDYFDWSKRGASLEMSVFFGAGFFCGLGCAGVLVVAALLG